MSILNKAILATAKELPEGGMLSPKEFLHLGSRAAVDQSFARLSKKGSLMRARRGAYVAPVGGRFGSRAPSTQALVRGIEAQSRETVVPNGAAAANALGLTTQMPIQEIFLTSGRHGTLSLGSQAIQLKSAPRWQMSLGKRPAGQAVRALSWLGSEQAHSALKVLHRRLPPSEWKALRAARAELPSWMARAIGEVDADG